jgi:hypothetical protein
VRIEGLAFGGTNVVYVKPADERLTPTLVGRFTLRRRQSFEGIALAADGSPANRIQAYYGEKLYLKSDAGAAGNATFRLVSEGSPPIPAPARARGDGWMELTPAISAGASPPTATWRVKLVSEGVEEDTDCSVTLHPRPVWLGWNADPPSEFTLRVSQDGVIGDLPKLYLRNRGTVGAIGLKSAGPDGEIVEITPSPGVEGDREYVGLDLTGRTPRLIASDANSANLRLLARSNLPGRTEWTPVALADGTPVDLTLQNTAGIRRLEDLVRGTDAAFGRGEPDEVLRQVDESLGPEFDSVWSDPATRDRMAFYKWFVNRYYKGVWRGADDPPEPRNAAFQAAAAQLAEIEWRNYEKGREPIKAVNFSVSTVAPEDDWISSFIAGYDAWCQLSLWSRRLPNARLAELTKTALDNLRIAAKTEKILSPLLLIEVENGLFQPAMMNAPANVVRRLEQVQLPGGPYGKPLLDYFVARNRGNEVNRSGKTDPAVGAAIIATAQALKDECPARAADLAWSFVYNKIVFPNGVPGGQLKAVFEAVEGKLLPEVVKEQKDRFQ